MGDWYEATGQGPSGYFFITHGRNFWLQRRGGSLFNPAHEWKLHAGGEGLGGLLIYIRSNASPGIDPLPNSWCWI